jgi:NAD(P)-dependent dehydrogenase (short-subunit alcohol dehydrogenase family)
MAVEDKVVVVTGGAQGIGMATCMAFAQAGARVFVVDADEEAGAEFLRDCVERGEPVEFVPGDVAVEEDVKELVEYIADRAGRIDVLVNNAGITDRRAMRERPMDAWDRVLAVNLRGPYAMARYAAPHMPPGSAIVNIASTRAFMSEPDTEPYTASKGGLVALTHSLAVSLADRRIRVNCISPGWIDTTGWKKTSARRQEDLRPEDHAQHPAGRVGTPQDIARACLFLADGDQAGFITGQNLVVDGGMTIKMIYVP